MNELIEKLSKEAWHQVDVSKIKGRHRAYTKIFAELLVKECVSALDQDDGATHHSELLLEHFGVEDAPVDDVTRILQTVRTRGVDHN